MMIRHVISFKSQRAMLVASWEEVHANHMFSDPREVASWRLQQAMKPRAAVERSMLQFKTDGGPVIVAADDISHVLVESRPEIADKS